MTGKYEDDVYSSAEDTKREIDELPEESEGPEGREEQKAFNDFIKGLKMKGFEDKIDVNFTADSTYIEDEQLANMYLDKDQKVMLSTLRCLIRGHSKKKLKWDLLIMLLAVFNCFAIPYQVAFEPEIMETISFLILNLLIDI
jgi:hypothetical protein